MLTSSQLKIILWNEKITVGLLDPDARTLVERLVIQADNLSELAGLLYKGRARYCNPKRLLFGT